MIRIALTLAIFAAGPAWAENAAGVFEGRVEAGREAVLSSRLNGVIEDILFTGGETVAAGQPMIRLDDDDVRLDLASAQAALAAARVEEDLARQADDRANALRARGVTAEGAAEDAAARLAAATADLKAAELDLARAELAMTRAVIRAPIAGLVGEPETQIGAFLEAEAGPPLARIVALDPIIVAYQVPYAARLAAADPAASDIAQRTVVTLRRDADLYSHQGRLISGSAEIDPVTGAQTMRAVFPNPDLILRPGLSVAVEISLRPLGN